MNNQQWSEGIYLAELSSEPTLREEICELIDKMKKHDDKDVVLDFSHVDIVTSSSLSALLRLNKLMTDCGRRIILCCVSPASRGVFKVSGIDEIFEFASDKFMALATLQLAGVCTK